jgi:hypothetical protein
MNAIILHGGPSREEYYNPAMPSASNAHWIPWLQKQLLVHDIDAATPEVPHAFDRNWAVWAREVERFEIGVETILVGHSTGAGFFVKYLSIHPELHVGKVMLVAPWIDPKAEHTKNFFNDFMIDPKLVERTKGITIFASDNDEDSVLESAVIIKEALPGATYKTFPGRGHFVRVTEFPELLHETIGAAQ